MVHLSLDYSADSQGWKIAGIAMGAVTCIVGIILILLTIFKQTRNRPWKYKKKEILATEDVDFIGDDDDDDDDEDDDGKSSSDDSEDDEKADEPSRDSAKGKSNPAYLAAAAGNSVATERKRETASSPLAAPIFQPLHHTLNNEMMFCPGCNRMHPTSHQCMYSTRVANGFATNVRTTGPAPVQDSIAIQTDDDGKTKKKKKNEPHTVIDRTLKYSNTTETQTDVTAKPGSNVTESIILRRVPIPTAKVVVQQPTTKVMIVKVPNTAGQLVLQQRPMPGTDH